MKFSTTVPSDPDTHEDFRPSNKLENSEVALKDIVEKVLVCKDVRDNPVMIYMKGVPEFPQCGFSSLAVRVLKLYSKFIFVSNSFSSDVNYFLFGV
ncbi:Monothiol glutaredoxin-S15, mitochondrial [Linum perenne]